MRDQTSRGNGKPEKRRSALADLFLRTFYFTFQIVWILVLAGASFALAGAAAYLIVQERISGDEVPVPEVTGLDVESAVEQIHERGLDLAVRLAGTAYSDLAPAGAILYQDPSPPKLVKEGSVIDVRVSRGTSLITCPDLADMNYQEAGILLRRNDLQEGRRAFIVYPSVAKDRVVSQDPAPGSLLERNTPVNLLVSLGPASANLSAPDLAGMEERSARNLIEAKGFVLGGVEYVSNSSETGGTVVGQSPEPGQILTRGARIDLRVADPFVLPD